MRVAVIGGGINGICTAWQLAESGHQVVLYERGTIMSATSSASTKLLHGGLRYLEHGAIRLVREALRERAWWVEHAPEICRPISIGLPVYRLGRRSRWRYKSGLWFYDKLSGGKGFGGHRWADARALSASHPRLRQEELLGAYFFSDGQMDDYQLGIWAAGQARHAGVEIREHRAVSQVHPSGRLEYDDKTEQTFDHLVNVAGPWARALLDESGISSEVQLDLIRGSHLILQSAAPGAFLLEHPQDQRMFFVLPYDGRTLVGTTEVRQTLAQPIACSDEELDYLLAGYNRYFTDTKDRRDVAATFAGVRPLLRTDSNPTMASREYAIETKGRLTSVFGGKWTTARALARRVAHSIESHRAA
jgi:glycerol-3-phosphate dehydrogenase